MSRNVKIAIGLVGGFLALCLIAAVGAAFVAGSFLGRAVELRPARVSASAAQIAGYTLPEGYHEAFSAEAMGATVVGIDAPNNGGHIYLATLPPNLSMEQLALDHEFSSALGTQNSWRRYAYGSHDTPRMKTVGSVDRTIRGQNVTMVMSEGVNSRGEPYREMAGVFNGKSGVTVLQIAGPVSTWDQATFDSFIASIS